MDWGELPVTEINPIAPIIQTVPTVTSVTKERVVVFDDKTEKFTFTLTLYDSGANIVTVRETAKLIDMMV